MAFESFNLAETIEDVLAMSDEQQAALRHAAVERVRERYSWDVVTQQYEQLFESMLKQ